MHARRTAFIAATAAILALACPALAGNWLTPAWPEGKEPQYRPVPLFWFEVRECPLVYRTEIDVPKGADRATALVRTMSYVYVYVDGELAYRWAPQPRSEKAAAIPPDPSRAHEVDLSDRLTPGRHVIVVSAPAKGFVLDGGFYAAAKRLAPLATDDKWTVAKFAPTTIIEDEPVMRPGYKGDAAPVKAGEEWTAPEDALTAAAAKAAQARHEQTVADAVWRLELLAKKGIYINGDAAYSWGGAARLQADPLGREVIRGATRLLEDAKKPAAQSAAGMDADLAIAVERLSEGVARMDEAKALGLASTTTAGPWPAVVGPNDPKMPEIRRQLQKALGHPLPRLNESRYDRLGWFNHPGLTDSDISKWGVRINPVTGPTKVPAPNRWLFATDPKDSGVAELRWSIGYNIETQMAMFPVGTGWQADKRFADYKGAAWYRTRLHVPGEWAGSEVVLTVPVAGQERLWLNDRELTARGSGQGNRTYRLAPEEVNYGGENFLAVRIQADGERRGLVGTVEAACPALDAPEAKSTPPVAVLSTPLSPCVVLTPETGTLEIRHAGKARLFIAGSGRPLIESAGGLDLKGGRLPAGNWVLVWPDGAAARPILLVFEKSPAAITCEPGLTRVKLPEGGRRIIAVRPWAKAKPPEDPAVIAATAAFWSRAALAVPVNYMEVTRVIKPGEPYDSIAIDKVPAGPVLGHTVVYDYLETKDEWGTKPLRIAPLPALASYAVDTKFRGLALDEATRIEVVQDGGMPAPYRAVKDADRVSYSYPVEPYPRFIGFTSWMFAGGDAGVTGNKRECELMAAVGANSFRPQHNWSDQPPPKGMFPPDDTRTRVQITADACKDAGINYMNNIDETLGDRAAAVTGDYPAFMARVTEHYEKIARQLGARPFWQVAYDLINEPFHHKHEQYNPALKDLTRRVRAIDKTHLLYIEPCEAWGAIQQLALIEPTGDPLTVYSFHDYNFRLLKPSDRWPTMEKDITNIYQMWMPAFMFQARHGVCMHCGEFGGFAESTDDTLAQKVLMNDFFRIFDQFGMHHHYYSGRQVFERLADGSCRPSNVARAYRAYFSRGDVNAYYKKWPGQPEPAGTRP